MSESTQRPMPSCAVARAALLLATKSGRQPDSALFSGNSRFAEEFGDAVAECRVEPSPVTRQRRMQAWLASWLELGFLAREDEGLGPAAEASEPQVLADGGRHVVLPAERAGPRPPGAPTCEHPQVLTLERRGFQIGKDGRLTCVTLNSQCFAQLPEWLVVRMLQMMVHGQAIPAAIVLCTALRWNWTRRLVVAWPSANEIAGRIGVSVEVILDGLQRLERWGILRRMTQEDRDLLAGQKVSSNADAIVRVLQQPEAWAAWEGGFDYVEIMNSMGPRRTKRP